MIRLKGKIEYADGSTEDFETGSAALAEWELFGMRHGYPIGDDRPPMLSALVIAHFALGVDEGFDVWRRTVAGIDLEVPVAIPPTPPGVSAA